MTKMKVNDIEIEIEDGATVEVLDGGKRIVVRGAPQAPVYVPYQQPTINPTPWGPWYPTITWCGTSSSSYKQYPDMQISYTL